MSKISRSKSEWPFAIPLAILILFAFLIAFDVRFIEGVMRPLTFDTYQKIEHDVAVRKQQSARGPDVPATPDPAREVVYLEIDPQDPEIEYGWPWPRNVLARLTQNLHDAGAEIIVFDIMFDKPDQQSPDLLLDSLWRNESTKSLVGPLSMLPDHDALLAAAFRQSRVVSAFYGSERSDGEGAAPPPFAATPIAVFNAAAAGQVRHYESAIFSIPVLASASAGNGANTVLFSEDWIVRELPLVVKVGDTLYPTQISETLRLIEKVDRIYLETQAAGNSARLTAARIGERKIPLSEKAGLWLNLTDTPLVPKISAATYLEGTAGDLSANQSHTALALARTMLATPPAADTDPLRLASRQPASAEDLAQSDATRAAPQPELTSSRRDNAPAQYAFVKHAPRQDAPDTDLDQGSTAGFEDPGPGVPAARSSQAPVPAQSRGPITRPQTAGPRSDPGPLTGKIVFIGTKSDPGKEQTRLQIKTAIHQDASATRLKATAVQQILDQAFLHRPMWAKQAEIIGLVVAGLILCGLALFAPVPAAIGFGIVVLTGLLGSGWYVYRQDNLLLDMTTPTLAAALSFVTCLLISFGRGRNDDIVVRPSRREAFAQNRPGARLASSPAPAPASAPRLASARRVAPKLRLGIKTPAKTATVMVCNVKGLTELEERFTHDPAGLSNLMEDFVSKLTGQVRQRQGHVLHVVGDQIIACWNLDVDDQEHQNHACECALRFLEVLDDLNERLEDQAHINKIRFNPIRLNIGINTGRAKTGLVGAKLKGEGSVTGEAIETAQWLGEHAEHYGPAVIVGEETYGAAQYGFAMLEIDLIAVDERPDPYRVFALLGNPVVKASPQFRDIERAHAAFFTAYRNKQWSKAWELVQSTRQKSGTMPKLYTLYESRIQHYMKNPPPQDWSGEYIEPIK